MWIFFGWHAKNINLENQLIGILISFGYSNYSALIENYITANKELVRNKEL